MQKKCFIAIFCCVGVISYIHTMDRKKLNQKVVLRKKESLEGQKNNVPTRQQVKNNKQLEKMRGQLGLDLYYIYLREARNSSGVSKFKVPELSDELEDYTNKYQKYAQAQSDGVKYDILISSYQKLGFALESLMHKDKK